MVAIEAFNIIPRYGGIIIHDCLASHLSYEHCGHGLCGSHLLRELTFIVESNQYAWAKNMKCLLQESCYKVAQSDDKKLTPIELKNLHKRYKNILIRGEKEMPAIPPKEKGERGKMAKSDAISYGSVLRSMKQLSYYLQTKQMSLLPIIEQNVT